MTDLTINRPVEKRGDFYLLIYQNLNPTPTLKERL